MSFLRTKLNTLRTTAETGNQSIISIFFVKLAGKASDYVVGIVNIIFIILFSPVILLLLVPLLGDRRKKFNVAFYGIEHIIQKTVDRALLYARKGYRVYFFSLEKSKIRPPVHLQNDVFRLTGFSLINLFRFIFHLYRKRPACVEFYLESPQYELITVSIICRITQTPTIVIERGTCMNFEMNYADAIFKTAFRTLLRSADKVYYREPYHRAHLDKMKIRESKLVFDPNRIPVTGSVPQFKKHNKTVLFLNSFVPTRRVDIFAEAIQHIRRVHPDATYLLVGGRSAQEMEFAETLLEKNGVREYVEVKEYTANPSEYYDRASIFFFPSDFVFANFSLLEAMQRMLVPVVADQRDAWRIIEDGKNGYLVPQSGEKFAEKVNYLLSHEDVKEKLAAAAREKILKEYNDTHRVDSIDAFIRSRVTLPVETGSGNAGALETQPVYKNDF